MKSCRFNQAFMLFIASLILLSESFASANNSNSITPNSVPIKIESKARNFIKNLKTKGFEVSRGYFKLWSKEDCDYTYERLGFCANNPAAPYVVATVPPWKEEFVDPTFSNIWGASQKVYNDIFRLDPHEAIVIMGQLPPPGRYFSDQTFVFSRQGSFDENSSRYKDIINSPMGDFINIFFKKLNDKRSVLFASLSNPNNNVVIERKSGGAFGQIRYLIITPDKHMDKSVREMFAQMAVDKKDVFTEPIPSDMNVGLSEQADDFTNLIRYAHPDDGGAPGTASYSWRTNPPLVVLRIREKNPTNKPQTYPPVVMEKRTAFDERPFKPDVGSLLASVARRWGQPCLNADCSDRALPAIDLQSAPVFMIGKLCIPFMENCLGDIWDASYHIRGPLPIDNNEVYVVAGVLGTKTGNATYVSLSINEIPGIIGVMDIDDVQLTDSANEYSAEVKNADKFYLQYFARSCAGLENLTYGRCKELSMIPKGSQIAIGQRDYIRQGTQRGPDSNLVLQPNVLKLNRP